MDELYTPTDASRYLLLEHELARDARTLKEAARRDDLSSVRTHAGWFLFTRSILDDYAKRLKAKSAERARPRRKQMSLLGNR